MKIIYQIRGWICRFIMQFEMALKVAAKFALYFFVFHEIAGWEGLAAGSSILNMTTVHLVLALICVLLPSRFVSFFCIVIIIYNIYQASLWGAVLAGVILLILYVMVARLASDEAVFMVLFPVAMNHNIFMILPLFAGMYVGVFSIISLIGGVFLWGFLQILPAFTRFSVTELEALPAAFTETFSYVTDFFLQNRELVFYMILCASVVVIVFLLNKISINYMRYLALAVGALVGFVCLLVGRTAGMTNISVNQAITIPLISLAILLVVEFFRMALNYQMAQRLTFSDDEYFYYVRAIPKILGGKKKTEVKTIATGGAAEPEAESEEVTTVEEARKHIKRAGAAGTEPKERHWPFKAAKDAGKTAKAEEEPEISLEDWPEESVKVVVKEDAPKEPAAEDAEQANDTAEAFGENEAEEEKDVEDILGEIKAFEFHRDEEARPFELTEVFEPVEAEEPSAEENSSAKGEDLLAAIKGADAGNAEQASDEPEEIQKRTGWSSDTIRIFLSGLDAEEDAGASETDAAEKPVDEK